MNWLKPFQLEGQHVCIQPLVLEHATDLSVAAGDLHQLWYTTIPTSEGMVAEIERRLQLQFIGSMLPFAIIDRAAGRAIGMTTYMNVDAVNRRVEIGSTWYGLAAQRTPFNTECKLLLLTRAFEVMDCIAVEFRTHFMNHQSRRAIERLGAKLDGVLRAHSVSANGTLRDTAVYSITATEWPTVKAHLSWQLARPR